MSTIRAVALLSGGLDSMLAIRILQEQGIDVEALNFRTLFTCCQDHAAVAAHQLGVRLTVLADKDDYLDVIRHPRHGYGRGANPCVDCRVYMFQIAAEFMKDVGAEFVVSGEVVGQRPMSQKRRDLDLIGRESDLPDRLLRPLSAKLLPPTLPEREGWVDRDRLFGFHGRSRKGLIALARQFGFRDIPQPSTGCALTEPGFAVKVHDLMRFDDAGGRWDFELLRIGRHFRCGADLKVIVGRSATENEVLRRFYERPEAHDATLLEPVDFSGPTALVVGNASQDDLCFAGGLVRRFAKLHGSREAQLSVRTSLGMHVHPARTHERAETAKALVETAANVAHRGASGRKPKGRHEQQQVESESC